MHGLLGHAAHEAATSGAVQERERERFVRHVLNHPTWSRCGEGGSARFVAPRNTEDGIVMLSTPIVLHLSWQLSVGSGDDMHCMVLFDCSRTLIINYPPCIIESFADSGRHSGTPT
eukprot:2327897-Amphidinium_carterae.1